MKLLLLFFFFALCVHTSFATNHYFPSRSAGDTRTIAEDPHRLILWKSLANLNNLTPTLPPGTSLFGAFGIQITTEPLPQVYAKYYVSPTGSDKNPGTQAAPFLTPAKAIAVAVKKDTILMERGGRFFTAPYIAPGKDSLFIGAYGTGAAPIWDGSVTIDPASLRDDGGGWLSVQNNSFPLTLNIVTLDGRPQKMARFPASGYRQFHGHNGQGQGYLIDTTLSELGKDFTGWQLVIRLINWSIGRVRVTKQSGDTLFYTTLAGQKSLGYQPINGWGYFLQNSTTAPASFGDFAYDSATKRVSVFYGTESPASHTLRIAVNDRCVNVDAIGVTFSNQHFTGQNKWAIIKGTNGDNTRILDCEIDNNGEAAFYIVDKSDIVFTGNNVHDILSDGIKALRSDTTRGCHRWEVANNTFTNIGAYEGMGFAGDPMFVALVVEGDYEHIYNNRIDSAGYNGIHTSGRGLLIETNLVEHTGFHLADGAGIYNYWGPKNPGTYPAKSTIRNNTVLHSIGSAEGTYGTRYPLAPYDVTDDNGKFAGIYLDENSRNFDIYGNNIGYTSWAAFMLNGTHNINIFSNTAFKFWRAYEATDYSGIVIPANNIRISSNIFSTDNYSNAFTVAPQNLFGLALNLAGRTASGWLTVDSNRYYTFASPTSNLFAEQTLSGHNLKTFSQWKSYIGSDAASTLTQKTAHSYYTNPTATSINATVTGIWEDADDNPVTGSVLVPAYGSIILFNSAKPTNNAPTANAGADISITYPTVTTTLNGNGADTDGTIASYSWTIVGGIGGSLSSPTAASTDFTGTPGASYLLRLTVTDEGGAKATDDVTVTVAKAEQEIAFSALTGKVIGDAPFNLSATATSGLSVSYTSSNPSVATVSGNMINIIATGETTITATQAGDENYSAAPAVSQTFSVAKASQSISFPALPNVSFGDAPILLNAVASSSLPVSYTVVSGPAIIDDNIVNITGTGNVIIEASQNGSAEFNAATPVQQQFTVGQASQVINFLSIPDLAYGSSPYSLQATSSTGLPIGYRIVSGPATINNGQVVITGTGTVIVEAFQDGNTNYAAAAVQQSFTVLKAAQQISFGSLADKTYNDAPFALNAVASSGLGVSYRVVSGLATVSGTLVSITGAGTVIIEASQPGDNNYLEAPPVQQSFVVQQAAQTIAFPVIPSKTFGDAPFGLTASASSALPVSYRLVAGPATLSDNIVSITGAGTVVIEAAQAGNDNFLPALVIQQSFVVAKADQSITFPSIASKTFGDAAFTVNATASSGLTVTYTVISGPATIDGSTVTITGAGNVVIRASQNGSADFNGATPVEQPFMVAPASQFISFPPIPDQTYGVPAYALQATSSSGLPVSYRVVSGPATVNGNQISITGAGVVRVEASQDGSSNYVAAVAVQQSFSVGKAGQQISFGALTDKTYGDAAFVVSATASSNLGVSYRVVSGPATISNNIVTITGAGTVLIEATQPGDANYLAAAPVQQSFTIAKANQSVTFGALANKIFGDAPFTLNATASSGLPVGFQIVSGPASLNGNTLTITGAGTVTAQALQAGDGNYNAALPVQQSFIVSKASQTITFPAISNKTYGDAAFAINATASSGLPVSFSVLSGPATVTGNTLTITGAGTVTLQATQNGSSNYNAALAVSQNFVVQKAAQTINFSAISGKTYGDPAFAVLATASSGFSVSFSIVSGPATISGNVVTITGAGAVTVQATQTGNANYNTATAQQSFTVAKKAQTITFPAIPNKTYGNAPFAINATASSGLAVAFRVVAGPASVSGNTVTITGAGTVTIEASQAGNNNFSAAPLVNQSFVVAKAAQTVSFPAIPGKTYGTAPFTLSGTASSGLAVNYRIVSGPATVSGNTLTITGAGTVTVEAAQPGNANYNAATPVQQSFTVAKANQTITFLAIPNKVYGSAPFALGATASSGLAIVYSVVSGPATVNGNIVTLTGTGKVTIKATQPGNANYNAATAMQQTFTVTKGSTATVALKVNAGELMTEDLSTSEELRLSVYPNPMVKQGMVRIQVAQPAAGHLDIYNSKGQLVKSLGFKRIEKAFPFHTELDVSMLAKGIYFLRFSTNKLSVVRAFTVL